MEEELLERFPALREMEASALRTLTSSARAVSLPPGAKAFEASTPCDNYLMVARGCIRVQQVSESGREIVLYRVGGGETCVLTTACLLAHESYSAEAVAETQVSGLVLPRRCFDRLIADLRCRESARAGSAKLNRTAVDQVRDDAGMGMGSGLAPCFYPAQWGVTEKRYSAAVKRR